MKTAPSGAVFRSPRPPTGLGGQVVPGREALAAAAFAGGLRIAEDELLVQPATHEVDLRAVHMREAAEIAILGALADDGVRYSLPQVTGARSAAPESALIEAAVSEGNPQV